MPLLGLSLTTILGPLLFLIFISDLPNVSKRLKFYLFADDTNIYYESEIVALLTGLARAWILVLPDICRNTFFNLQQGIKKLKN